MVDIVIRFIFDYNGNDFIYLHVGNEEPIHWNREWVEAMSQMEITEFESYYRNTIRPKLNDKGRATLDNEVVRQEIPGAFDRLRSYFWGDN